MSAKIIVELLETPSGWDMQVQEYKGGELVGASVVYEAALSDCEGLLSFILSQYKGEL